uniref:Uncharacterized protein n=1 Tax=Cacopsylla melanoneura TaxID=428564 RepID=A0A8D8XA96_9HEMI
MVLILVVEYHSSDCTILQQSGILRIVVGRLLLVHIVVAGKLLAVGGEHAAELDGPTVVELPKLAAALVVVLDFRCVPGMLVVGLLKAGPPPTVVDIEWLLVLFAVEYTKTLVVQFHYLTAVANRYQ